MSPTSYQTALPRGDPETIHGGGSERLARQHGALQRVVMALRLLLDSADPQVWQQWLPTGLFSGITTNPTLLRRAAQPCSLAHMAQLSELAFGLGAKELHLQAWGEDLLACGRALAQLAPGRIWVKLPITAAGAAAARSLVADGTPVTFTACYEPPQVLLAAALGADYIAPYLGRICDQGRDGHSELITMQRCIEGLGTPLRLLVASLRCPGDLARLAAEGLNTFTISPAIAEALFAVDATLAAAEVFERDARAL